MVVKCPKCKIPIKHCGFDSPYYYCSKCGVHYHINLFISNNEFRKRLGLDPEKEEITLEKWL